MRHHSDNTPTTPSSHCITTMTVGQPRWQTQQQQQQQHLRWRRRRLVCILLLLLNVHSCQAQQARKTRGRRVLQQQDEVADFRQDAWETNFEVSVDVDFEQAEDSSKERRRRRDTEEDDGDKKDLVEEEEDDLTIKTGIQLNDLPEGEATSDTQQQISHPDLRFRGR